MWGRNALCPHHNFIHIYNPFFIESKTASRLNRDAVFIYHQFDLNLLQPYIPGI